MSFASVVAVAAASSPGQGVAMTMTAASSPLLLVGRAVQKEFLVPSDDNGNDEATEMRLFSGKVVSYDAQARVFQIAYEDGDGEEMTEHEVRAILAPAAALPETADALVPMAAVADVPIMQAAVGVDAPMAAVADVPPAADVEAPMTANARGTAATAAASSLVVSELQKEFPCRGAMTRWYSGTVVAYHTGRKFYQVRYEDGDEEEMEEAELRGLLVAPPRVSRVATSPWVHHPADGRVAPRESSGGPPSEEDNMFRDVCERIVTRATEADRCDQHHDNSGATADAAAAAGNAPPLSARELSQLSLLCARQGSAVNEHGGGFRAVDAGYLATLALLLHRHVLAAVARVHLIRDAVRLVRTQSGLSKAAAMLQQWIQHGQGKEDLLILRQGLEAASITLFLAVCTGSDKRRNNGDSAAPIASVVDGDSMEAAITLYRHHLINHLLPSLNQTGHLMVESKTHAKFSPARKRRRSSASQPAADQDKAGAAVNAKDLKSKLYPHIWDTMPLQMVFMERLEMVVRCIPLDDQQILVITDGSLQTLEIDCTLCGTTTMHSAPSRHSFTGASSMGQQVQIAATSIVRAAFGRYPHHRETILADIYPVLLRVPTGKRSMRSFPLRYASSSAALALAALNEQHVLPLALARPPPATLPGKGHGHHLTSATVQPPQTHLIQMATALVLSLVQASVVRPAFAEQHSNDEDDENEETKLVLVSGLTGCQSVADSFCSGLLQRCALRSRGAGATEYRPFFTHFVQDLLAALVVPEYPAASLLLSTVLRMVNRFTMLASSSSTAKKQTPPLDNTFLTVAFDAWSKMGAIQASILAAHRQFPIKVQAGPVSPKVPSDQSPAGEVTKHMNCSCRDNALVERVYLVCCDDCRQFSHGSCVGIHHNSVPDEWVCDPCRLGRIWQRERRQLLGTMMGNQNTTPSGGIDEIYAMRQSFLSSLAHRSGVSDLEPPTKYHVAQWADELQQSMSQNTKKRKGQEQQHQQTVAQLLVQWDCVTKLTGEPLTEEGSNRVIVALLAKTSPFILSFPKQLQLLATLMEDAQPNLRKLAVKTVEKVIEGDSRLMLVPKLNQAVAKRLSDESISVREAAVSLVGRYVEPFPALAKTIHGDLVRCLSDEGVSVRKRGVQIFRDILIKNPRYKNRSEVCNAMLQRSANPEEEDSVRDTIHDLFVKLWLQDADAVVPSVSSSTVSSKSAGPSSQRGGPRKRIDMAAEQMMEVVRAGGTGEHLETLLKELLGASASIDKSQKAVRVKREDLTRSHCEKLANALFDLLISIEEEGIKRKASFGKDLVATLQTLGIFADVSSASVLKRLDQILPFLKADNNVSPAEEAQIVEAAASIVSRLAPSMETGDIDRLSATELGNDLKDIVNKFGSAALAAAVHALSSLAHHAERGTGADYFGARLLEIARTYYKYLLKHEGNSDFSKSAVGGKVRSNTQRALAVLGLTCRYHEKAMDATDWEDAVENIEKEDIPDASELTWSTMHVSSYRLFSSYLEKLDSSTQSSALRALGGIFLAEPRLMLKLQEIGLIGAVMAEDAHDTLQLEALRCWRTILETHEKRVDGGEAMAKMDGDDNITVKKRISGDQDGDSNLFGGVLTTHAGRLFQLMHSTNHLIRHAALELLGVLSRQGMVNPNEAIPHLLALQGDVKNKAARSMSLQLLHDIGKNRPDSLRQRVSEGVKQAYIFQKAMYPNQVLVSALVPNKTQNCGFESVFDRVFIECMATIRKERRALFKSLLGLFKLDDLDEDLSSPGEIKALPSIASAVDLALLSFVSQILAHLPYKAASDPLFIIRHISTLVATRGEQILDRLAGVLRPVGLASEDELDENNAGEDDLEKAAAKAKPSKAPQSQKLFDKELALASFVDLCRGATALTLLLRLKPFLAREYNLSETRCMEFDPEAKDKISDKTVSKAEFSKPFDAAVAPSLHVEQNDLANVDMDDLIRQYAEFRRLMREESFVEAKSKDGYDEDEDMAKEEPESLSRKRSASET